MPARRPRNFSWFIEGVMAASGFPETPGHFQYLREQGIDTIITLTDWKPQMEYAGPGRSLNFVSKFFKNLQLELIRLLWGPIP